MIAFWVVAGLLAAGAAALMLLRAARAASEARGVDPTALVYRRQLSEIGDLAERGLIGAAERMAAEAEAARRLLKAAEGAAEAWRPAAKGRGAALAAAAAAPALALGLYMALGSPGVADQPFGKRLDRWLASDPASLRPAEMAAVLQRLTRERPNDPEGFRYLALAESASDNPAGAVRAVRRAVRLAPERADLWEMLGEALLHQSGGEVTEDAKAAFREALRRDPKAAAARFHLARAQIAGGDKPGGLAAWRALLADLPGDDTRIPALRSAIAEAEGAPAVIPRPQMEAIEGMVASLAQRLQSTPEDPDGWVRLVRAYAVLGDAGKRDAALKEARARFASRPDILGKLAEAAKAEPMR